MRLRWRFTMTTTAIALVLMLGCSTVASAQPVADSADPGSSRMLLTSWDNYSHSQSLNWSGYDTSCLCLHPEQHTYTYASARWVQPAVTCEPGEDSWSSFWVGLDGDGDNTIEQTGTSANCRAGTPTYSAWYAFNPAARVIYSNAVQPGDAMLAIANYHSGTDHYVLTLTDATQGWTHTIGASAPGALKWSADVVAEAAVNPLTGSVLPLSNFGSVTFTKATVNGTGLMHVQNPHSFTMSSSDDAYVKAAITAIKPYNEFTVGWRHH